MGNLSRWKKTRICATYDDKFVSDTQAMPKNDRFVCASPLFLAARVTALPRDSINPERHLRSRAHIRVPGPQQGGVAAGSLRSSEEDLHEQR